MTRPSPKRSHERLPAHPAAAHARPVHAVRGSRGPGQRTNTLAIVALILGILVPIGGIICGHIALGQIKRTGETGAAWRSGPIIGSC